MEPFSVFGLIMLAVLVMLFGRVLHTVVKVLFYTLIGSFVLVFFFGVSMDQVLGWGIRAVMWAF